MTTCNNLIYMLKSELMKKGTSYNLATGGISHGQRFAEGR